MQKCHACGTMNEVTARFCENCGGALVPAAPPPAPPVAPPTPPAPSWSSPQAPRPTVTPGHVPFAAPSRVPEKRSRRKVLAAVAVVGVGVFGVVPRAVNGWDSDASEGLSDLCKLVGGSSAQCLCYTQLVKLRISRDDFVAGFGDDSSSAVETSRSIADFCGITSSPSGTDTPPERINLPEVKAVAAPDPSIPQAGMFIGSPDAPATIVEYSDYQCPWCAKAHTEGFGQLLSEYIATGKLRYEFRPFSFLGDESVDAAKAALCAADQGKFWAMHELIFGNQHDENTGAFSPGRLEEMADLAGLDMAVYEECFKRPNTARRVDEANQVARDDGISSTPTFVIDDQVFGWPPDGYQVFKQQIDEALAAAS